MPARFQEILPRWAAAHDHGAYFRRDQPTSNVVLSVIASGRTTLLRIATSWAAISHWMAPASLLPARRLGSAARLCRDVTWLPTTGEICRATSLPAMVVSKDGVDRTGASRDVSPPISNRLSSSIPKMIEAGRSGRPLHDDLSATFARPCCFCWSCGIHFADRVRECRNLFPAKTFTSADCHTDCAGCFI
jgi:hypothetical protein